MTPSEMARHWRVGEHIASEIVAALKASNLVATESAQTGFEGSGRVRLTTAGEERVPAARQRTFYAGPLPVALSDFEQHVATRLDSGARTRTVEMALAELAIDAGVAAEIAQAVTAQSTVAISGLAGDEQLDIIAALTTSPSSEISLPYAIYAAGAVIRMFDRRYHRTNEDADDNGEQALDILRTRASIDPWLAVQQPTVILSGGVQPSDALPAYDEEARFYLAPAPLAAAGGILAVLDADANPNALADLARLWLVPGRYQIGVLLLRSGERIEVPWRATTVLLGATPRTLPAALRPALVYSIKVGELNDTSLHAFLARRFTSAGLDTAVEPLGAALKQAGVTRRDAAARAARYVLDRAAYERDEFSGNASLLQSAIEFARAEGPGGEVELRRAS
jgi:hypothetical protein